MTARIDPPEPTHAEKCRGEMANHPYEHGVTNGRPWIKHQGRRKGDLRRCEHGIIQICHWPDPSNERWAAVESSLDYEWRDISKLWERKLYRRAVEALESEAEEVR